MIKVLSVIFFLFPTVLFADISSGEYGDIVGVTDQFIKSTTKYLDALDREKKVKYVLRAINIYIDDMRKIMPLMKKISEEHPELSDNPENMPEELVEVRKKAQLVSKRFTQSYMKLAPFMGNEDVVKAQMRLSEVMSQK